MHQPLLAQLHLELALERLEAPRQVGIDVGIEAHRDGAGEHRPVDINAVVEDSLNLAYHGARAETICRLCDESQCPQSRCPVTLAVG